MPRRVPDMQYSTRFVFHPKAATVTSLCAIVLTMWPDLFRSDTASLPVTAISSASGLQLTPALGSLGTENTDLAVSDESEYILRRSDAATRLYAMLSWAGKSVQSRQPI